MLEFKDIRKVLVMPCDSCSCSAGIEAKYCVNAISE